MSPKKKTTKKFTTSQNFKSLNSAEPEIVKEPVKQSHDWLPDEFDFSESGVTACWAEERPTPSLTKINWIVVMANCDLESLPKNWQSFVQDARKAGYYIEYKFAGKKKELWKINPPARKPYLELPFQVKLS